MAGLSFGLVLAFLCPGLVGVIALSYHFPILENVITEAQRSSQSVGIFLFAAVLALASGVVIAGIRAIVLDGPLYWWLAAPAPPHWPGRLQVVSRPGFDFSRLKDSDTRAAFEGAVEAYLRFYHFYAHMLVAIILLSLSYLGRRPRGDWPEWWPWLAVGLSVALLLSALGSLKRYALAVQSILAAD